MAKLLLGKVLYKDAFAGYLEERPGGRVAFTYDSSYIDDGHPAISHSLPLCEEPYINDYGLHPFFDNLVAEGWLEGIQSRKVRERGDVSNFELLLAFGYDLAGAISVLDQDLSASSKIALSMDDIAGMDELEKAVSERPISLSGVQAKIAVVEKSGSYSIPRMSELSTHIAKLSSSKLDDLVENEYLTMLAFKALLPNDEVAEVKIEEAEIGKFLLVKRFDRKDGDRLHFEEFNQLLEKYSHKEKSEQKYEGSYKDMADFIFRTDECLPTQAYLLYCRILAGILLGNTDMHFKNFAMLHIDGGLRLAPSYDQVAAVLYGYDKIALEVAGSRDHYINDLKAKHLCLLGEEFQLPAEAIADAVVAIGLRMEAAKDTISDIPKGHTGLKDNLIKLMDKRWNGTFSSVGKILSQRQ